MICNVNFVLKFMREFASRCTQEGTAPVLDRAMQPPESLLQRQLLFSTNGGLTTPGCLCLHIHFSLKTFFLCHVCTAFSAMGSGSGNQPVGDASAQTVDILSGRTGSNAINWYRLLLLIFWRNHPLLHLTGF